MAWGRKTNKEQTAQNAAPVFQKETNRIAELEHQIQHEKQKIEQVYTEVGRRYVQNNRTTYSEEYADLMKNINYSNSQIKLLEMRIQREKGILICPECKRSISQDSVYCNYCGTKQDKSDFSYYTICESCGKLIEKHASACVYCGVSVSQGPAKPTPPSPEPAKQPDYDFFGDNDDTVVVNRNAKPIPEEPVTPPAPEVPKKRICPKCGTELEDQQNYCTHCGKKYPGTKK